MGRRCEPHGRSSCRSHVARQSRDGGPRERVPPPDARLRHNPQCQNRQYGLGRGLIRHQPSGRFGESRQRAEMTGSRLGRSQGQLLRPRRHHVRGGYAPVGRGRLKPSSEARGIWPAPIYDTTTYVSPTRFECKIGGGRSPAVETLMVDIPWHTGRRAPRHETMRPNVEVTAAES